MDLAAAIALGVAAGFVSGLLGVGAAIGGAYGNLHLGDGLLVGIPACGGVLAGTAFQQRVPPERLSLIFAALLVVVAVTLLI